MAWKYRSPKQRGISVPDREFSVSEQRNLMKPATTRQKIAIAKRFSNCGETKNAAEILKLVED